MGYQLQHVRASFKQGTEFLFCGEALQFYLSLEYAPQGEGGAAKHELLDGGVCMHEFGQLLIGGSCEAAGGECLEEIFGWSLREEGIGDAGEGGWIGENNRGFLSVFSYEEGSLQALQYEIEMSFGLTGGC